MMNIALHEYGIENTLREIRQTLEEALGKIVSKELKDIAIAKALGLADALFYVIEVENDDNVKIKLDE